MNFRVNFENWEFWIPTFVGMTAGRDAFYKGAGGVV